MRNHGAVWALATLLVAACGNGNGGGMDASEAVDGALDGSAAADGGGVDGALDGSAAADGGMDAAPDATTSGPDASTPDASMPVVPFVSLTSFQAASLELGQADFVTNGPADVQIAITAYGHASWAGDTLYVPSSANNRILAFHGFPSRNGEPGDFAIGQPDLVTTTTGSGASGMDWPQTVEVWNGRLYVLDYGGSRLMGWSTLPTTSGVAADFAVGQADLGPRATGCARALTNYPDDFTIGGGRLFVSDRENHRVLVWNTVPTTSGVEPDLVLGQGDFTHCTANDDDQDGVSDTGPTARTIRDPIGLWSDGTRLFVADYGNNRVLAWNTVPTTSFAPADFVLGQPDATSSNPGTAADRMNGPNDVAGNGTQLAITESGNNRVLVWNAIPAANAAADVVLGQSDFAHGTANDDDQDGTEDAHPSARTLRHVVGLEFVRDALIVTDIDNDRMMIFGPLPCPAGQYEPAGAVGTCVDDPCQPDPCGGSGVCRNDSGAAVCQ